MFSKFDFRFGYCQVCIKDESVSKATFKNMYVNYEYIVVPFGLTNASTTFTCLMNGVFKELFDKFIIVFLDNILLYSKCEEEHEENI